MVPVVGKRLVSRSYKSGSTTFVMEQQQKGAYLSGLRILGIILSMVGVLIAVFPGWFDPLTGGSGPPVDVYEGIERRVRGGMVLGVGLIFIAVTTLRPWSTSIPLAIFYLMTGALAARLLGLIVDGIVPKQWLLVAVEAVFMALVALWLWRSSGS